MAPSASDVGREVLAGEHGSAGEEVRRGALDDGLPPSWPAPGPTSMIQSACAHHRLVVLDDDDRLADSPGRWSPRRSCAVRATGSMNDGYRRLRCPTPMSACPSTPMPAKLPTRSRGAVST